MRTLKAILRIAVSAGCVASATHAQQQVTGVVVAAADRAAVDFALAHSPTFREHFELASSIPGLRVELASTPGRALGGWPVVAATGWTHDSVNGRRTIRCRVRHSGSRELAARMAHELVHAHELAVHGRIESAPTFEAVGWAGSRETRRAVEVEERVRRELRAAPVLMVKAVD